MDASVHGKIIRQKFFRIQNRVERFWGDWLLTVYKSGNFAVIYSHITNFFSQRSKRVRLVLE